MSQIKLAINGLAILCLATIKSYSQQDAQIPISQQNEIAKTVMTLLHEHYIYPDRIEKTDALIEYKIQNAQYDSIPSLENFLDAINTDLTTQLNDSHVEISYGPKRVEQIRLQAKNENDIQAEGVTERMLHLYQFENFRIRKLERLDGNIGYFKFLNFPPLAPARESFTGAMSFLRYSNAIIMDLRDNGGGNAETMHYLLNYFLPDSTHISTWRHRKNDTITKIFTPVKSAEWKIPSDIPVFILVNRKTSSAAEGFAYTLQQSGRAIVIGEQTQGEGNPGSLFDINDVLYVMIPTIEAMNAVSGKSIDGIGVTPDVLCDPMKTYPHGMLEAYTKLASLTNDKSLGQFYTWQIPFYQNEIEPALLDEKTATYLTGTFESGRKILYDGQFIWYYNTKGEKDQLQYLGEGVFQNINKPYSRLVMPFTDQQVPYIEWTWDDGGEKQRIMRETGHSTP